MAKEKEPRPIPPIEHPEIKTFDVDPYRPEKPPFVFPPALGQGLFRMEAEQYFQLPLPDQSFYKAFSQSPAHGLAFLRESQGGAISPLKRKAFDFGTALHLLMLEPDLFTERIVIDPGLNKISNDYKAWRDTVPAGAITMTSDEIDSAMQMRDRAMRKDTVRQLLSGQGISEVSGIFEDAQYPVWHKIRIDKLVDGIVIDYKTAASASRIGFEKAIWQYKYYWQAALYLHGASRITRYRHEKFVWIVQEKDDPWECRVIVADPVEIREAETQLEMQIERFCECMASGYWPGYPDEGIEDILPRSEEEARFDEIDYQEEVGI